MSIYAKQWSTAAAVRPAAIKWTGYILRASRKHRYSGAEFSLVPFTIPLCVVLKMILRAPLSQEGPSDPEQGCRATVCKHNKGREIMIFGRSDHNEVGLNGSSKLYSVGVIPQFPPVALWASLILDPPGILNDRMTGIQQPDRRASKGLLSRGWE